MPTMSATTVDCPWGSVGHLVLGREPRWLTPANNIISWPALCPGAGRSGSVCQDLSRNLILAAVGTSRSLGGDYPTQASILSSSKSHPSESQLPAPAAQERLLQDSRRS